MPPKQEDEESTSFLDPSVAHDLLLALEGCGISRSGDTDDANAFCDIDLIGAGGVSVPACRFLLAARSPVFSRMLYGPFREAKSSSIALLGYEVPILRAVVYFCSYHQLDPTFPTTCDAVSLQLQLMQAADYLQMPVLATLVSDTMVLRHMALHPERVVCTVLEQAPIASDLCAVALQMIETRPYITLDPDGTFLHTSLDEGGVTILSAEKLELILKSAALGASEYFILQQLSRWYHSQRRKLPADSLEEDRKLLNATAKALCQRYIPLSHIEPSYLLSPTLLSRDCPFLSSTQVFEAISHQALRASKQKIWHLPCRGALQMGGGLKESSSLVDRVLVEGSGCRDADGMYYQLTTNSASAGNWGMQNSPFRFSSLFHHGTKNVLYTKREVVVGQQYVYTLSRCLRYRRRDTTVPEDGIEEVSLEEEDQENAYYECRIFVCPFLTQGAVRSLQRMQATASLVPCYQPVLQVVLTPPCISDNVPTPIRKYYRVRLSDGELHMPATLAPELNALVERNEIDVHRVLRVLEFGVYTIYGCAAIHVLKAVVIHGSASAKSTRFGNPLPLEDAALDEGTERPTVQHLYRAEVEAGDFTLSGIPKSGWRVEAQGRAPAPECTWIPAAVQPRAADARSVVSAPVPRTPWTAASTNRSSSQSETRRRGGVPVDVDSTEVEDANVDQSRAMETTNATHETMHPLEPALI